MQISLLKIDDVTKLLTFNVALRGIPVLSKVWERVIKIEGDFDGRRKKQNIKDATFIHLYCHFLLDDKTLNPYFIRYGEEERFTKLVEHLEMPESWKIDDVLQKAIDFYKSEIVYDLDMEMYDGAIHALRQTAKYFKGVDYDKRDSKYNFLYTPEKVMASIAKVNGAIEDMNKAKERIINNQKVVQAKVRGGGDVGSREVPKR